MTGLFFVPHSIYNYGLSKTELAIITALFKIRADRKEAFDIKRGWFYTTNEELAKYARVSLRHIRTIKPRLQIKGLLDYRCGTRKTGNRDRYFLKFEYEEK